MKPLIATALLLFVHRIAPAAPITQQSPAGTTRVVFRTDSSRALAERWKAAGGVSRWVGWSITRRMGSSSYIGSFWSDEERNHPSLLELVTGRRSIPVAPGRHEGFGQMSGTFTFNDDTATVVKEVAILVHFPESGREPDDAKVSNLELHAELGPDELVWLGPAQNRESLALLSSLYRDEKAGHVAMKLVEAIGVHQEAGAVFPLLSGIAGGDGDGKTRADALYWIAETHDPEALAFLTKMARNDGSKNVRESAVFAIGELGGEKATDGLIALAKDAERSDVRKNALFWLGQKASRKAVAMLSATAENDVDLAVQKSAVYALAQLPDNGGTEPLIKLAHSHADARIRKEAIYQLGQSDDPRALEALIEIVRK